jgi:hypothetical protein
LRPRRSFDAGYSKTALLLIIEIAVCLFCVEVLCKVLLIDSNPIAMPFLVECNGACDRLQAFVLELSI